jgi:tripeptide aminopeptidase
MINESRLIQTFLDLVQIDSPTGSEKPAAEYCAARLRALGLEPKLDALHNVVAFLPGEGEPFFLNAHTDGVQPCLGIRPRVADGKITSDGTTILGADDRAGVAAILEAVQTIVEEKIPHRPLEIVFTVQEEVGLVGAKNLDLRQFQSKVGVVMDSHGPVGTIIVGSPTHNLINATIRGRAAHSGLEPEKGISAIQVAAEAIAKMKLGRIDAETTANVGTISGGAARNIVAEKCELMGEARSRSVAKLKKQTDAMVRALKAAAKKHRAKVEIKIEKAYDAYNFTKEDAAVRYLWNAIKRVGRKPKLGVTGGGSDANVFIAHGLHALVTSVGYERVHTTAEFIPVAELVRAAELVVALTAREG